MALIAVFLAALVCAASGSADLHSRLLLQDTAKTVILKKREFPFLSLLEVVEGTGALGDCEDACKEAEGCISFTRMKKTRSGFFTKGSCFLYAGIGRAQRTRDSDSGILPPRIEKPKECEPMKGVSFLGTPVNDGNNLIVKDVEECCVRCQDTDDCESYTFLKSGACFLKSDVGRQFACGSDCQSGTADPDDADEEVLEVSLKDPQPPEGKWDFVRTGLLSEDPLVLWEKLGTPDAALSIAFRQLAFNVDGKETFTLELPSGEEFKFGSIKTNKEGMYHVFKIESHTKGIVSSSSGPVSLVGSELFIRLVPDVSGHTRVNFGFQAKVDPEEAKSSITGPFDGFFKTLVFNLKLAFGSGDCFADPNRRETPGTCNNPENPSFGAANIPLKRLKINDPVYADKKSKPSGPVDISPRFISNKLADEGTDEDDAANKHTITDTHVYFGQFVDHDIGLSPTGNFISGPQPFFSLSRDKFSDPFPITIPDDDKFFTGKSNSDKIGFMRSVWVREDNEEVLPRQHLNQLTSFLDLGQVYGSENVRAISLRSFKKGLLKANGDGFLPFNGMGEGGIGFNLENGPNSGPDFYVAGDIRANEVVGLVAMHGLWFLEHNRIAAELDKAAKGKLDDEALFTYAKDIAIAEYQSIVYNEYLPLILGDDTLDPNDWKYDPEVDASVDSFFTTVSFRFGHSMVNNFEWKVAQGTKTPVKKPTESFLLREVFFKKAGEMIDGSNLGDWLRGMCWHEAREMDTKMVSEMRNFLFTKDPKVASNDLTSLNIQRARDFGLPMYNAAREAHDLDDVDDFEDVTCDKKLAKTLEEIYPSVDDIDPFIGGLAECPSSEDRLLGDLFHESIKDNFRRFRDGDRLFYKGFQFDSKIFAFYPRLKDILDDKVTLKDIIIRNTDSTEKDFAGRGNVMWLK